MGSYGFVCECMSGGLGLRLPHTFPYKHMHSEGLRDLLWLSCGVLYVCIIKYIYIKHNLGCMNLLYEIYVCTVLYGIV